MASEKRAKSRGHEIHIKLDDDGQPSLTVDGEAVPVGLVEGGFKVTYHSPEPDLLDAAKKYVRRLPVV